MNESFQFTIPEPVGECAHKKLSCEIEASVVESCPKGCDGEQLVDITISCADCGVTIEHIGRGHEGCKYGR